MSDVTRVVETQFNVTGDAQGRVNFLGRQFSRLGGVVSRVTSLVNPLNLALGALGGALSVGAITRVGSEFESLQIGMAQTLRFMGQGGNTWNDAMERSEQTIRLVLDKARRREPGTRFNIKSTLNFPNGSRARIIIRDVEFGELPISFGSRSDYGMFSVDYGASEATVLPLAA